jgi:hypothetical protein
VGREVQVPMTLLKERNSHFHDTFHKGRGRRAGKGQEKLASENMQCSLTQSIQHSKAPYFGIEC